MQTDWLRFWTQFQTSISSIPTEVTSFSYLKEHWITNYIRTSAFHHSCTLWNIVSKCPVIRNSCEIDEVSGSFRMTLDKPEGIRSDFVWTDDNWQEWKFPEFTKKTLRKWQKEVHWNVKMQINSLIHWRLQQSRIFQTRPQEDKIRSCVYCEDLNNRSTACKKVVSVKDTT